MTRRTSGLTLVELLLAAVLAAIVLALALGLVLSSRKLFTLDRARTDVNENLRSGMDIIMTDVRQAGERLGPDMPAVRVGKSATGDTLTLRRNLLDAILPVCASLRAGASTDVVFVAQNNSQNPECKSKTDPGAVGALLTWDQFRISHGTKDAKGNYVITAYIFDPVTVQGEFFAIDQTDSSDMHVHRVSGKWQHDYSASDRPRLYLLEQRTYTLDASTGTLQLTVDGGAPQNVVPDITAFKVDAYLQQSGGDPVVAPGPPQGSFAATNWQAIAYLEVAVTGVGRRRGGDVTRTLVDRATPRNVLSSVQAAN